MQLKNAFFGLHTFPILLIFDNLHQGLQIFQLKTYYENLMFIWKLKLKN